MTQQSEKTFIVCLYCNRRIEPDLKSNKPWICVKCNKKLPNLKRHWRSIADVYAIQLSISLLLLLFSLFGGEGFKSTFEFISFWVSILISVIIPIIIVIRTYSSARPWEERSIRFWITVWLLLSFISVLVSFSTTGSILIVLILGFWPVIILLYFLWLSNKTKWMIRSHGDYINEDNLHKSV